MQTLELEGNVVTQLKQAAKQAKSSPSELLNKTINNYITENSTPATLNDFIGILKDSPTFKGDPVEIQRKMRDE